MWGLEIVNLFSVMEIQINSLLEKKKKKMHLYSVD